MDENTACEIAYKNGYKKGSKETAEKIYRELEGHGTTYVKKWIKEQYNLCRTIEPKVKTNKKEFVDNLACLFNHYCSTIETIKYFNPGKYYDEEVIIVYEKGFTQVINVSLDDIPEMLRNIGRYLDV